MSSPQRSDLKARLGNIVPAYRMIGPHDMRRQLAFWDQALGLTSIPTEAGVFAISRTPCLPSARSRTFVAKRRGYSAVLSAGSVNRKMGRAT